ncbi:MAG: MFS transporter [Ruminococcus sp.]|nr:MFS transporter [Ruminococcus sp.]
MNSKIRKYLTIVALGMAGGSIYFLPYIKFVFYDAQIASMGITNVQSGLLMTVYTVVNMILYIPGGILADKLSAKKSLIFSLAATSLLAYVYAFTMKNFVVSMIVYLGLSLSTAFVFWSSLMKAVRIVGTEEEQGFMYGVYYACNGIMNALTGAIALRFFNSAGGDMEAGFFRAVVSGGSVTIVAAILLAVLMKEGNQASAAVDSEEDKFKFADVGKVLKNPVVWVASFVIFCGDGIYTSVSYFNPYLTEVIGITPSDSSLISVFRQGLLLLAPVGGILADKIFKSTCKWLTTAFGIVALLFASVMFIPASINPTVASVYTLVPSAVAMMLYGVIFSVMSEAGIPRALTGTAIGIASIIGYTPDSLYSLIFGGMLDKFGGQGYNYIFTFLIISCVIGAVLAQFVRRLGLKAAE